MSTHPNAMRRPATLMTPVGLLLAGVATGLSGVAVLFYCYAFASMVDPSLTRWETIRAVLTKMFLSTTVVAIVFGGVLVGAGIFLSALAFSRALRIAVAKDRAIVLVSLACGAMLLAGVGIVLFLA
ncbi:MAG: hypothetical protein ACYC35_23630 [Pirellulales bacterium]